MVSPVVMYGCESWAIKKAEHQGIDAFELWCLRRLSAEVVMFLNSGVGEDSENPLNCKEIKPVHLKENES